MFFKKKSFDYSGVFKEFQQDAKIKIFSCISLNLTPYKKVKHFRGELKFTQNLEVAY